MILELASLRIQAGETANFEAAYKQASLVIATAKGYITHQLQRSVDVEHHYILLVQWQTRDDHMIGFRESPLFVEWRRLLGPYFAATPEVEHFQSV